MALRRSGVRIPSGPPGKLCVFDAPPGYSFALHHTAPHGAAPLFALQNLGSWDSLRCSCASTAPGTMVTAARHGRLPVWGGAGPAPGARPGIPLIGSPGGAGADRRGGQELADRPRARAPTGATASRPSYRGTLRQGPPGQVSMRTCRSSNRKVGRLSTRTTPSMVLTHRSTSSFPSAFRSASAS